MPMHKIFVDDEIFSYLKSKAEPFVDNPNTVLRRELLGTNGSSNSATHQNIRQLPPGIPKALEEILQVIYLVRVEGYNRSDATHAVAQHHNVENQTVTDKYTRQLGITAREFDEYLAEDNPLELKALMNTRFMGYENIIKGYL